MFLIVWVLDSFRPSQKPKESIVFLIVMVLSSFATVQESRESVALLIAWVLNSLRPAQHPKEVGKLRAEIATSGRAGQQLKDMCALRQRIYRNKREKLQNQIKVSVPNCLSQTENLQNQIKASVPNSLSQTVRYSALI